jgi:phage replication O-like protein O
MTSPLPTNNFTQMPNVVFDYWMSRLKDSEFKILVCLCRKIYGWHKTSDSISVSQLCKVTGLAKQTVINGVKELESLNLVTKIQTQDDRGYLPNTYKLNTQIPEDKLYTDENLGGGGPNSRPPLVQNLDHPLVQNLDIQKKDSAKERHTKEKSASPPASAEASALSSYFFSKMKEKEPDLKPPKSFKEWDKEMEKLLRLDKRDPEKTRKMIDWIVEDKFSSETIRSPEKLRKHYDLIAKKIKNAIEEKLIRDNKNYCFEAKKEYSKELKDYEIKPTYIINNQNGKDLSFIMNHEAFKNAFKTFVGAN